MTGFGIVRGKIGRSDVVVEARSVNHRYCEVNLRCPGRFAVLESEIGRRVRERFARGKFDLFLREESLDREDVEVVLARKAHRVLKKIRKELGLPGPVTVADILTCREIFFSQTPYEDTGSVRGPLLALFEKALEGLQVMRQREGARLKKWLENRIRHLKKLNASIERQSRKRGDEYRRRLEKRWKGIGTIEEQRLLQEAALMAERADVTEEIVRLKSHLKEFERFMHQNKPVGRKLDFLAQEMGRETNTIGSKSQGVRIAHQVIQFKSELERIREQIQNVE